MRQWDGAGAGRQGKKEEDQGLGGYVISPVYQESGQCSRAVSRCSRAAESLTWLSKRAPFMVEKASRLVFWHLESRLEDMPGDPQSL